MSDPAAATGDGLSEAARAAFEEKAPLVEPAALARLVTEELCTPELRRRVEGVWLFGSFVDPDKPLDTGETHSDLDVLVHDPTWDLPMANSGMAVCVPDVETADCYGDVGDDLGWRGEQFWGCPVEEAWSRLPEYAKPTLVRATERAFFATPAERRAGRARTYDLKVAGDDGLAAFREAMPHGGRIDPDGPNRGCRRPHATGRRVASTPSTDDGASRGWDGVRRVLGPDLRALFANRSFRRLFSGRIVSVVGDAMYVVATMWLVYELTGSTFYTGLAGFLTRAPGTLQVFVGPIVDRAELRRALVAPEVAQGVVVLALPAAAAVGLLEVPVVLATVLLVGVANLFSGPAQHAILPSVVDDDRLVRANSLFSTTSQGATAATRVAGGALVAALGAVALYLVDAATFAVAAVAFLGITASRDARAGDGGLDVGEILGSYRRDLARGAAYVVGTPVGLLWVGSLVANLLVAATLAVLPAYAAGLGGSAVSLAGATTYGLLYGATGAGTFVDAAAAPLFERRPFGATAAGGFLVGGVAWVGAVLSGVVEVAVVAFAVAFVPIGVYRPDADRGPARGAGRGPRPRPGDDRQRAVGGVPGRLPPRRGGRDRARGGDGGRRGRRRVPARGRLLARPPGAPGVRGPELGHAYSLETGDG